MFKAKFECNLYISIYKQCLSALNIGTLESLRKKIKKGPNRETKCNLIILEEKILTLHHGIRTDISMFFVLPRDITIVLLLVILYVFYMFVFFSGISWKCCVCTQKNEEWFLQEFIKWLFLMEFLQELP